MSDEVEDLVERLLDWPYQGESMAEEAAVLIKQLTAERDKALAANRGLVRLNEMTEAHAQRLRAALEDIVADCEAEYPPSHGAIKYAARAALKGETP